METQQFKISIGASREKVWNTLWSHDTYPQWTALFSAGSHAETDWKKGSKVFFLDDKRDGMVATVSENKPNEFMSFRILGEVRNGIEDLNSDASKQIAGGEENYTLKTSGDKTQLVVETGVTDEMKDYLLTTWPKALEALKALVEKN